MGKCKECGKEVDDLCPVCHHCKGCCNCSDEGVEGDNLDD